MQKEIKIDDVTFIIDDSYGIKLVGFVIGNEYFFLPRTSLNYEDLPYTFFERTLELYKRGKLEAVRKFLKEVCGKELSIEELEEKYKIAEERVKEQAEKRRRIKRVWGLWF